MNETHETKDSWVVLHILDDSKTRDFFFYSDKKDASDRFELTVPEIARDGGKLYLIQFRFFTYGLQWGYEAIHELLGMCVQSLEAKYPVLLTCVGSPKAEKP